MKQKAETEALQRKKVELESQKIREKQRAEAEAQQLLQQQQAEVEMKQFIKQQQEEAQQLMQQQTVNDNPLFDNLLKYYAGVNIQPKIENYSEI